MPQRNEKSGVLVVSRDSQLASLRQKVLRSAGFVVIPATNLREVTAACEKHTIRIAMIGYCLRPAEKRRIANAIKGSCRVPVLQLHRNEDAELLKSTFSHSHFSESDQFIETMRTVLRKLSSEPTRSTDVKKAPLRASTSAKRLNARGRGLAS